LGRYGCKISIALRLVQFALPALINHVAPFGTRCRLIDAARCRPQWRSSAPSSRKYNGSGEPLYRRALPVFPHHARTKNAGVDPDAALTARHGLAAPVCLRDSLKERLPG
jgi:hypothetical protein